TTDILPNGTRGSSCGSISHSVEAFARGSAISASANVIANDRTTRIVFFFCLSPIELSIFISTLLLFHTLQRHRQVGSKPVTCFVLERISAPLVFVALSSSQRAFSCRLKVNV